MNQLHSLIIAIAVSAALTAAAQAVDYQSEPNSIDEEQPVLPDDYMQPVLPLQLPPQFDLQLDDPPIFDPEIWVDTTLLNRTAGRMPGEYSDLTDDDYIDVAQELGIESAVMKAVVDIETGRKHEGFHEPGKPIINFDLSMYRQFAPKRGVNIASAQKSKPVIFQRPNVRRYGSYQAGQYARLDAARQLNERSAFESTFWGMFQIGGFNWRKCGCDSIEQFVALMSRSERDQLELFARFVSNSGMLDDLRAKRWLSFALKYNGPKAKARGYHTRLAAAYKKYKALEEAHPSRRQSLPRLSDGEAPQEGRVSTIQKYK